MTDDELKNRVESSPGLRRVRETLLDEVSFRADGPARLDPMTILMIISLVIQVIKFCIDRHSEESVVDAIRNARTLPRRRLIVLRRRLNRAMADCVDCPVSAQPVYDALLSVSEELTDEEIAELMHLSRETAA